MFLVFEKLFSLLVHAKLHIVVVKAAIEYDTEEVCSIAVWVAVVLLNSFEEVNP